MGKEGTIRILNLFTIMNRGGAETMVMNYYRKIDRTKVQFDFLVHREQKGAFDDEIKELGGKIYHICPIYPHNFSKYKRMAAQFLDEHPEYHIIHSHISELGYFMLKEAYKRNIPVRICHAHNTYYGWDLKMFVRIYFKLNIRKYVTHMFACSMDAGEWLFGKRNHDRIRVINNAIDTSLFQYKESVRENVRKELGIQGKFVIGNVGRFEKQKNHTFVIDVFKKICKKRDDAVLLLVGGGKIEMPYYEKSRKTSFVGEGNFSW